MTDLMKQRDELKAQIKPLADALADIETQIATLECADNPALALLHEGFVITQRWGRDTGYDYMMDGQPVDQDSDLGMQIAALEDCPQVSTKMLECEVWYEIQQFVLKP